METASPQTKAMVEPFITVTRLKSTPNATAHATLAFVAAFIKADERKLHGQVLLDGEFCDIHGVCGAPIQLTHGGWRIASYEPLTWHEKQRLTMATRATDYVFDLAARVPPVIRRVDGSLAASAEPDGRKWQHAKAPSAESFLDGFA